MDLQKAAGLGLVDFVERLPPVAVAALPRA